VLSETNKAIENAEEANHEVTQAELNRDALNSEISEANQTIADLNANIGRLTEQRQGLLGDITKREEAISALDERRNQMQERIAERTTEREGLAREVGELKQKLRALEDDVNMFPTEIGAFVSQGGANIRTYWKLAAVPIALMVVVTGLLVFNAANLTTVFDEVDGVQIWSILITRIPYVIIATAIITASYKLARVFVAEIMRINQQRLNLSKISIVATDASNTSQEGLTELTDRELYELRTDLKMQLLRDHLKEYLSSDFRYQGKSTNNWTHLLEKHKASKTSDMQNNEANEE
jgi:prefoldin subunit 5